MNNEVEARLSSVIPEYFKLQGLQDLQPPPSSVVFFFWEKGNCDFYMKKYSNKNRNRNKCFAIQLLPLK